MFSFFIFYLDLKFRKGKIFGFIIYNWYKLVKCYVDMFKKLKIIEKGNVKSFLKDENMNVFNWNLKIIG